MREFQLAILDGGKELLLADVAGLAPIVPAAIVAAAALKRGVAAKQDVGDDAQRPEIASLVVSQVGFFLSDGVHVVQIVKIENFYNLRGHVFGRTDRALKPGR